MKTKTDDLQVQGGQSEGEDQSETDSQEESTPSVPNGTNDAPGSNDYDSDEFDSEEPTDSDSYGGTENDEDELEVSTAQSLEDALKDLASNEGWENVYLELPKLNLNQIVIPNADIHSRFDEWNDFLERHELTEEEVFGNADREFKEVQEICSERSQLSGQRV